MNLTSNKFFKEERIMRKLFLTLAVLFFIAVIAAPPAMAIGTASGTAITNQAFGDYQDANGNARPQVPSNIVTMTVSQVANVRVNPTSTGTSAAVSTTVYYAAKIYNDGNAADTLTFSIAESGTFTASAIRVYRDLGAVGTYDSGTDVLLTGPSYTTGSIAADAYYPVIIAVDVPAGAADGSADAITLTATSTYTPAKTATGTYTTTVSTAIIAMTKSHTAPSGYKPGDIITYQVTMQNNGSGAAYLQGGTDIFDSRLTYVPGTLRIKDPTGSWTSLTDACDTDPACVSGHTITVTAPSIPSAPPGSAALPLPPGTSYIVEAQVRINADVSAGTTIDNMCTAIYRPGTPYPGGGPTGPQITVSTAPDSITVTQVNAIALATTQGNQSGNPGDKLAYKFTVTNNGNASDTINLTFSSTAGRAWLFYADSNGNGTYDSGTDAALTDSDADGKIDTGLMLKYSTMTVFAVATIPPGTGDGVTDLLTVTGTSKNDPTKTGSVSWTTTTTAPNLSVLKEIISIQAPAAEGGALCTATNTATGAPCTIIPGSIITFLVTATNNGTGNATNVSITDTISPYQTYATGSLYTGSSVGSLTGPKTEASDGDNAQFDGSIVSTGKSGGITLGHSGTWVLQFKVTVN
jgi:uncharacterized repeat protein (TIGR01451 family)/fimbrial isopeptide formation D2 family protein